MLPCLSWWWSLCWCIMSNMDSLSCSSVPLEAISKQMEPPLWGRDVSPDPSNSNEVTTDCAYIFIKLPSPSWGLSVALCSAPAFNWRKKKITVNPTGDGQFSVLQLMSLTFAEYCVISWWFCQVQLKFRIGFSELKISGKWAHLFCETAMRLVFFNLKSITHMGRGG